MISVGEIEQKLRGRVEALAAELLPNARRDGHYLKVGSIDGEAGQSLVIHLKGAKQGKWQDYAGADHGDMLDLIQQCLRLGDKREAVRWAKDWLGIVDQWSPGAARAPDPAERARRAEDQRRREQERAEEEAREREAKIRGAKALFLNPASVALEGTPAEAYLGGRGLERGAKWPGTLRFNPQVWCRQEGVKLPAMLAAVYLADGRQVATHRTWLEPAPGGGWRKLKGEAKKVLGPIGGGFVPISKGASGKPMSRMAPGEPVYMAEGIEDCLAIRQLRPDRRIIAAISLGNMAAVVLPEQARSLVIVADRDDNERAVAQLERAIAAQQARGLEVSLVMPPKGCKDINEWLLQASRHPQRDSA